MDADLDSWVNVDTEEGKLALIFQEPLEFSVTQCEFFSTP